MKSVISYRKFLALTLVSLAVTSADASGAYLFANSSARDRITHPRGYNGGTNQHLVITVGIRPNSPFAQEMEVSVINAINTWNQLEGRMPNLFTGSSTDIPTNHYDFESTLVHEMGHALGLAHPNLASESGLPRSQRNYAKSTMGESGAYSLNAGSDGIQGSQVDLRGDNLPLVWFHKASNDPFANPNVVDSTAYSINLSDLPTNSTFAAIGGEAVSARLGHPRSEAVMHQGTTTREQQRDLTPGCVAHVRMSMAGVDRIQGTDDDYTFELQYVGFTNSAHMPIGFDDSKTSFASAWVGASMITLDHFAVSLGEVYFNSTYRWHFNQLPNFDATIPDPDQESTDLFFIY